MSQLPEISRDHPIPDAKNTRYPWDEMEVGDSFFVPGKRSANMSSTASAAGKRLGQTFVVRAVIEHGRKGVRVWRKE